jgi:two-component system, chemotaxis family, sensor kinase Cph1
MKVIDIVNREKQTLEQCDQEPIHIPGAIQPHGFLIAVTATPGCLVKYCSANCVDLFQQKITDILGKPIVDIISPNDCPRLISYLENGVFDTSFSCKVNHIDYAITTHQGGDLFVLEFEQFPDGSLTAADQFNQTKRFLNSIQRAESFQKICQSIADVTRDIIGYDRVMIYRFDKEYNGEVFAESRRPDLPSFLGHHYPHTDIPAQARELYLKNLLRIIVDVHYAPVPILTLDEPGVKDKPLDMSYSVLRSVSPMHLEYLKNMGVAATLTISLIENKKLWGLIACHNYAPKHVPFYTRLAAQLQGHFFNSQISVRQSAAENELTSTLNDRLENLLKEINHAGHFLQKPELLDKISQVPNATGVAIIRNGVIQKSQSTPSVEQIRELLSWLISQSADGAFVTHTLPLQFESTRVYGEIAAGVVYHNLGNADKDGIIWFRSEMDKTINWAGNPTKVVAGNVSAALTPRKSFELWQEKVKYKSTEWLAPELNAAARLAHILHRQFYAMYLEEEEKRYIDLNENLKKANAELANLNWIGTHDLKEPLRKIQIFASRILQAEEGASPMILDSAARMKRSATRMQELVTDLLQYSQLNQESAREAFEQVDLNTLVGEVIAQFEDDIVERKARINTSRLPVVSGIPFQLTQLFVNLIDNSIKFTKAGEPPIIAIQSEETSLNNMPFYKVSISDEGIGFDSTHVDKIFDVFKRLHSTQYSGTGIGLAICKKVMENHGGRIDAVGNEMRGATFELYFPR